MYNIYYQHNPERLSTNPVTVHACLHIPSSIEATGLSGVLGFFRWSVTVVCFNLPSVIGASLSHPLDRHVLEDAQLTQIKTIYDKAEALALKEPSFHGPPRKSFEHPDCMD